MKTAFMNLVSYFMQQHEPEAKCLPSLTQQLEQARQEWLNAQNYYDNVSDADLVDHASYLMQAAEKNIHIY